jgi:hypothetical protein
VAIKNAHYDAIVSIYKTSELKFGCKRNID